MNDRDCVELLRWALPRLHMRWRGFRKVRRQVCRRIQRRMQDLSVSTVSQYRAHLEEHREEWPVLRKLCRVTVSRFYRDKGVFTALENQVLPALARRAVDRDHPVLSVWSAGCASGEEPYTCALLWRLTLRRRFRSVRFRILATDIDEAVLARAAQACYPGGALRDLPPAWRRAGFDALGASYCLRREFKRMVVFRRHDVCDPPPGRGFDLILCRNLLYTYFDVERQIEVSRWMIDSLLSDGVLVVGTHERPPMGDPPLRPLPGQPALHQKTAAPTPD